jgi:hypothetical protein
MTLVSPFIAFFDVKVPLLAARSGASRSRMQRLAPVREDDADEGFMITDKADLNLWQCLQQLDFWLLTFSAATTTGIALAFINNASAIVRSLDGDQTVVVCSCLACVDHEGYLPCSVTMSSLVKAAGR